MIVIERVCLVVKLAAQSKSLLPVKMNELLQKSRTIKPTAYIWEWLRDLGSDSPGDPIYEPVNIEDAQEDRVGRVNITSSWRIGPGEIGYMVNESTSSDGQNTFKLNVMCRCNKDEAWSPKLVDVTISF